MDCTRVTKFGEGTQFVYDEAYGTPLDDALHSANALSLAVLGLRELLVGDDLSDEWHALCELSQVVVKHLKAAQAQVNGPMTPERAARLHELKTAMGGTPPR
jgi:hypothetical protein